jgi:hypothetical protein
MSNRRRINQNLKIVFQSSQIKIDIYRSGNVFFRTRWMLKHRLKRPGNVEVRPGFLESVDFSKVFLRILCIYFLSFAIKNSFLHVLLLGTALDNGNNEKKKAMELGREHLPTTPFLTRDMNCCI